MDHAWCTRAMQYISYAQAKAVAPVSSSKQEVLHLLLPDITQWIDFKNTGISLGSWLDIVSN